MTETKIRVDNLKKHFPVNKGIVSRLLNRGENEYIKAVDGVSLELEEGEAFGLAGESGCGKTTTGKSLLRLIEPTAGKVYFDGEDVTEYSHDELNKFRREAQIIYQDPYESLNPRFTVYKWVVEPLKVHDIGTKEERYNRVCETLEKVNLEPPASYLGEYPGDLSGGERQRVAIARAIILDPSFLLADEPASMLDVSIRARVLDLFQDLQKKMGLTALYISHDLSLLKYMCDRIAIMYLGKIVEVGKTEEIINNPKHPYTKALVSSVPVVDPDIDINPILLKGSIPDPVDVPSGCSFHPRCPEATEECSEGVPPMYDIEDSHARCILYDDYPVVSDD